MYVLTLKAKIPLPSFRLLLFPHFSVCHGNMAPTLMLDQRNKSLLFQKLRFGRPVYFLGSCHTLNELSYFVSVPSTFLQVTITRTQPIY